MNTNIHAHDYHERRCPTCVGKTKQIKPSGAGEDAWSCTVCGKHVGAVQVVPVDFGAEFHRKAARIYGLLMAHRERYVRAWVAATGIPPEEAMLVERRLEDGTVTVTIERRAPVAEGSVEP